MRKLISSLLRNIYFSLFFIPVWLIFGYHILCENWCFFCLFCFQQIIIWGSDSYQQVISTFLSLIPAVICYVVWWLIWTIQKIVDFFHIVRSFSFRVLTHKNESAPSHIWICFQCSQINLVLATLESEPRALNRKITWHLTELHHVVRKRYKKR